MDFSNYEPEIRKMMESISKRHYHRPQECMKECNRIIREGRRKKDVYLLGFGYYYFSEGCFYSNDYKNFVKYLTKGIPYQQESGQWMLLARSYNMMGINALSKGNTTVALDHYLQALEYSCGHRCDYESGLIYTNMAQLYVSLKEYAAAISYFKKARSLFLKFPDNSFAQKNLLNVYTILGRCYLARKEISKAEEMEACINSIEKNGGNDGFTNTLVKSFLVHLRHLQKRYEERDCYIAEIMDSLDSLQTFMEIWEDVVALGELLLSIEKFHELYQLFQRMEVLAEKLDVTNMTIELLQLRIRYDRAVGETEHYYKDCARLFEYGEVLEKENIEMLQHSVKLRLSLEEAKGKEEQLLKEKNILKEKSERDPLTGLPNRYRLNDYAEEIFEKAYLNQENLGVEILDIDHFKQYNDGYGHQAGDECLRVIADLLKEMMRKDKNVFCCRYGGDEFVILYYGKSDEEVLARAKELKQSIVKKKMPHAYSKAADVITISQGIRNTVPKERNRVWDFLYSADGALYEAKEKGKNSICLIHEISSESDNMIMLVDEEKENDI